MNNRNRFNEMAGSARGDMPAFQEATRQTPARPATLESEFWVPLFQALGCGLAVGGPLVLLCHFQGWPSDLALFAGVTVAPIAWIVLLADHRRLLWQTDTIRGIAADPEPPLELPPAQTVLELTTQDERGRLAKMQYVDLPAGITEAQIVTFAAAVIGGDTLAQGRWTGGGNPFSRAQYDALMARLQRAGLVDWKSGTPAQGRELTPRGHRVLSKMAGGHQ